MLRPSLVVTLLAALALAAAGMAVAAATRARSMHATTAPSPPAAHPVVAAVSSRAVHAGLAQRVRVVTRHAASARQSGAEVLRVRAGRSLTLRDRPRGSVIANMAFQRVLIWEIPFMSARFVWFRAAVSLPFPFLAAGAAMLFGPGGRAF